jgi:hypothetical protein
VGRKGNTNIHCPNPSWTLKYGLINVIASFHLEPLSSQDTFRERGSYSAPAQSWNQKQNKTYIWACRPYHKQRYPSCKTALTLVSRGHFRSPQQRSRGSQDHIRHRQSHSLPSSTFFLPYPVFVLAGLEVRGERTGARRR